MPTVGRWQYKVEDIMSGELVGTLPLTQVTYTHLLNRPGAFSGKLTENEADPELLQPGQKAIYAFRDGALQWGGPLWDAPLNDDDTVSVSAEGWLGYWDHRNIDFDYTFTGLDEFYVFQALVAKAQDATLQGARADLGISVAWDSLSGIPVTGTYAAADQKNLGQELRSLSQADDGFDMNVVLALTGNTVGKTIRLDHPYKGRRTGITLRHSLNPKRPGMNVLKRSVTNNAAASAWRVWSQGNGQGNAKLTAYRSDETKRGLWPLLDASVSWNSQQNQSQLDRFTQASLLRKTGALKLPVVHLNPNQSPQLGEYDVGDIVTYASDGNYLGGIDDYRINGISVTVTDEHSEDVQLVLERLVDSVPGE